MALVRDDCLVPTLDAKELGYIRESTPQQYVPDVFYKVCVGGVGALEVGLRSLPASADKRGVWSGRDEGGPTSAP